MNKRKLTFSAIVLSFLVAVTLFATGVVEVRPLDDGYNVSINLPPKQPQGEDVIVSPAPEEGVQDGSALDVPKEPEVEVPSEDSHFVQPLNVDAKSNTQDGSVKYGATIVLGDLDMYGRSTYAHMRLKDEHEPGYKDPATGQPREKRNERINVDPAGWKNFKIDGKWANNRCHLLGYQFSGLNDELRNLATCTSYLNKGSEGSGTDQKNIDGMLYYEQLLDKWLSDNPTYELDYYVKPIYTGRHLTPNAYYLQWVGFDDQGNEVTIDLGGKSLKMNGDVNGVVLENMSPSYNVDTLTGIVSKK